MSLRPYQNDALDAITREYLSRDGCMRQLLVLPTGTGKTVCFAALPKRLGMDKRMMVLVHREELAQQAAHKISRWNPDIKVGIEMAGATSEPEQKVVVASVQTLSARDGRRLEKFNPADFGVIVCDEAHHSTATSYLKVFGHFNLLDREVGTQGRLLLGVTATPNRGDGAGLSAVYDSIVYNYSMLEAIKAGWLSDMKGFRIRTTTSLDGVHTSYGDFKDNELAATVNTPARNELIVSEWKTRAGNRQTLVFTVDIAHAQQLAEAFKTSGTRAEAIWGNDPERTSKLHRHRSGDIQVLTNCGVLTEGYDDWRIGCIVMARPTKSQLLFVQMAGRGTRIPEDISNAGLTLHQAREAGMQIDKQDCLLLDVTDNTSHHNLATLASIFGLPSKLDMNGMGIVDAAAKVAGVIHAKPGVDLSQCEDLEKLLAHAEEVDLFAVKFQQVVIDNSAFMWHETPSGNFVLALPGREDVAIYRDLLENCTVDGTVNGNQFGEKFTTLQEAFQYADSMVRTFGRSMLTLIKRENNAAWTKDLITPRQLKHLCWRLRSAGKSIPPNIGKITKFEASKLIGKLILTGASL